MALLLAAPALADGPIYRWTDDQGGVHFTKQLLEVPAAQRQSAIEDSRANARAGAPSRLQTISGAEPAAPSGGEMAAIPGAPSRVVATSRGRGPLRIPFVQRGTLMLVEVQLNDQVRAPFFIDTGASAISIPDDVVRRLGIRIGADTPRLPVQTASGIVSEPLIRLDSVQVGPARIEGVQALVNESMEIGLLGGSFFNNFVYEVDAAESVITLRPNDSVRGGLSQDQWRKRFRSAREEMQRLETYRDGLDQGSSQLAGLNRNLRAMKDAFEELEREANEAEVPRSWRE